MLPLLLASIRTLKAAAWLPHSKLGHRPGRDLIAAHRKLLLEFGATLLEFSDSLRRQAHSKLHKRRVESPETPMREF